MRRIFAIAALSVAMAVALRAQPKNAIRVTIASGQSLSAAVALRSENLTNLCTPSLVLMPSAWTTANLTFQVSVDGTNFYNLYDDAGSEVIVNAAANRAVYVPAAYFWGVRFLRIRSGTSGTPVNQAAERQLVLACRD